MIDFLLVILGFAMGLWLGQTLMGRKWAKNADGYARIEHKGELYKVFYDSDIPTGKKNILNAKPRGHVNKNGRDTFA